MSSILLGVLIGGVFGFVVWWALFGQSSESKRTQVQLRADPTDLRTPSSNRSHIMDRWSVRLAIGGLALGAFFAFTKGWATIGFMIGFGLPFSVIGLLVGLVIDWIKNKERA
jgi:hypothetical protein